MKRYNKNGQLETIMCNCCGKSWWCSMESSGRDVSVLTMHGIIFSEKDGQVHHFDLCEECCSWLLFMGLW